MARTHKAYTDKIALVKISKSKETVNLNERVVKKIHRNNLAIKKCQILSQINIHLDQKIDIQKIIIINEKNILFSFYVREG